MDIKDNLELAAILSLQAYDEEIPLATKVECKKTSTTAFLRFFDQQTVVVFRGTQQLLDWKYNLRGLPWRYKGRWCHKGFATAHKSLWAQIEPYLEDDMPVLFTGHSLGAVLAEYSAWALGKHKATSLITFGKPNGFLKKPKAKMPWLKAQVSVCSGSDLVARIPHFCYAPDSGQQMLYFDNTKASMGFWNPPREAMLRDWHPVDAISDHSMDGYKDKVFNYIEKSWVNPP
tara:strand:+ start:811 stop:1503 length:693 start_codon:yes stop_codon:yes gene_type:complete